MTHKHKIFIIVFTFIFFTTSIVFGADSITLNNEITSVSFHPSGFGFGLAPSGTDFRYYKYFKLSDNLKHDAFFQTSIQFAFPDQVFFGGFNYKTGKPNWISKNHEITYSQEYFFGDYFNPQAIANIYFSQGFGLNPISQSGPLITIGIDFNTRYSLALEALDVYRGKKSPTFIDPVTNTYKPPFESNNHIQAYPWLQDSRETFSNYIRTSMTLNLSRPTGFGIGDGLVIRAAFEYGPSWLFNNISMSYPTSDYYYMDFSATQTMSLFSKYQDNGFNWVSIQLVHSNSISHTGGTVIPNNKLPMDRLSNTFTDKLYLEIKGPQFIAYDCTTDFTLGIYNDCFFGSIVNENSDVKTKATEWKSSFNMRFHMKLFGFMHFSYSAGYNFMHGIQTYYPEWKHDAKITFYIAL